jgi:2-phosphosulfolactate phosphatase
MQFSRCFLNRLQDRALVHDTVVVVDVLRSFTTAAVALARGASTIYPVEGIAAALALTQQLERPVSVGAIAGGDPVAEFDHGNSPARLLTEDLRGRPVVLSTAAGVRGLQRFNDTRRLYAASLVCARATAQAIAASGTQDICFVITGEWVDRDGDEDIACADYIEALLSGRAADPARHAQRVRDSDFGRRFGVSAWPNLTLADLELCADVDRFDFAMPVARAGEHLVIR